LAVKSHKKLKGINLFQTVKYPLFIIVIFFLIIIQFHWVLSIRNIQISYDLSNYTKQELKVTNLNDFFEAKFAYMKENPINLTTASEKVLENETLMYQIESRLNSSVTSVQEIYNAYLNGSLDNLIIDFFREMWHYAFTELIPEEYYKPAFINLTNQGWASINNITVYGDFLLENKSARFLKSITNILSFNEPLILEISLANLINAIANITYDILIDLTITLLENNHIVNETVLAYFKELIKNFQLSVSLYVNGRCGFVITTLDLKIDLNFIIKNL